MRPGPWNGGRPPSWGGTAPRTGDRANRSTVAAPTAQVARAGQRPAGRISGSPYRLAIGCADRRPQGRSCPARTGVSPRRDVTTGHGDPHRRMACGAGAEGDLAAATDGRPGDAPRRTAGSARTRPRVPLPPVPARWEPVDPMADPQLDTPRPGRRAPPSRGSRPVPAVRRARLGTRRDRAVRRGRPGRRHDAAGLAEPTPPSSRGCSTPSSSGAVQCGRLRRRVRRSRAGTGGAQPAAPVRRRRRGDRRHGAGAEPVAVGEAPNRRRSTEPAAKQRTGGAGSRRRGISAARDLGGAGPRQRRTPAAQDGRAEPGGVGAGRGPLNRPPPAGPVSPRPGNRTGAVRWRGGTSAGATAARMRTRADRSATGPGHRCRAAVADRSTIRGVRPTPAAPSAARRTRVPGAGCRCPGARNPSWLHLAGRLACSVGGHGPRRTSPDTQRSPHHRITRSAAHPPSSQTI
jgi:hypothetical protein